MPPKTRDAVSLKEGLLGSIRKLTLLIPTAEYDREAGLWSPAPESDIYQQLVSLVTDALGEPCEVYSWVVEANEFRLKAPLRGTGAASEMASQLGSELSEVFQGSRPYSVLSGPQGTSRFAVLPLICSGAGHSVRIGCIVLRAGPDRLLLDGLSPELESFTAIAARTIYENRLIERWKTLIDIEAQVLGAPDVRTILLRSLEAADHILQPALALACYEFDAEGARFRHVSLPTSAKINGLEVLAAEVRRRAQITIYPSDLQLRLPANHPIRAAIAVPVSQAGVVIAVLLYGSSVPGRFGDQELLFIQNVARAISHGIGALEARKSVFRDAVVGAAASTLVHDLNQYAGIVRDVLRHVEDTLDGPVAQALATTFAKARRAHQQIRQIVDDVQHYVGQYQKDALLTSNEIDVNEVVRETTRVLTLKKEIPSYTTLHTALCSEAFRCSADQLLLQTFLRGFIHNSLRSVEQRAMNARGKFSGDIKIETLCDGPTGRISIIDNGEGISDISRAKKYRPDGLGFHLPFTMDVIHTYWNGSLEICSPNELGGTTMKILLPLAGSVT